MSRCLIPINENYYLLMTMDFEEYNFDKIIMEKIIPLIREILDPRIKFSHTINIIKYENIKYN
jgi:hypothetical protein